MSSVPTRPIAREPTLLPIVQIAPMTARLASPPRLVSGAPGFLLLSTGLCNSLPQTLFVALCAEKSTPRVRGAGPSVKGQREREREREREWRAHPPHQYETLRSRSSSAARGATCLKS